MRLSKSGKWCLNSSTKPVSATLLMSSASISSFAAHCPRGGEHEPKHMPSYPRHTHDASHFQASFSTVLVYCSEDVTEVTCDL